MRILFSMRHAGALRNFESTIAELARRGHDVHLVFMILDKLRDDRLLLELTRTYPNVTYVHPGKKPAPTAWAPLARDIRATADFLRYCAPPFATAHVVRERARKGVPPWLGTVLRFPGAASHDGWLARLLSAIERLIPVEPEIVTLLADWRPDVVLLTPLVELASPQVAYVKAARLLGIRTALCVHSWDNLTTKGPIRAIPNQVFVWNEAQKQEAVDLHGVPPDAVVVTGAPVYDQWFDRQPSTSREEFCRQVGLSPEKPFFLYLCSSKFIAPEENRFVKKWISSVRAAADPRLREAGILVRPHPGSARKQWQRFKTDWYENVAIWPREGENPVDATSRNNYFDSLYHAAAAVGVNTSAQIEAGIVGRQVLTICDPAFAATQDGMLHFHHLVAEGGGLLTLATSFDEHTAALARVLDRPGEDADRLRQFVHRFVRPHGLTEPATPRLAAAVEALGRSTRPVPVPDGWLVRVWRWTLYPFAALIGAGAGASRDVAA